MLYKNDDLIFNNNLLYFLGGNPLPQAQLMYRDPEMDVLPNVRMLDLNDDPLLPAEVIHNEGAAAAAAAAPVGALAPDEQL